MRLVSVSRATCRCLLVVVVVFTVGCSTAASKHVPVHDPDARLLELLHFANGVYAMTADARQRLYDALNTPASAADPLTTIKLIILAEVLGDGSSSAPDPARHIADFRTRGTFDAVDGTFVEFMEQRIRHDRARASRCRQAGTELAQRESALAKERARCADLEQQIEGLLRLESEMNERTAPADVSP